METMTVVIQGLVFRASTNLPPPNKKCPQYDAATLLGRYFAERAGEFLVIWGREWLLGPKVCPLVS